MGHFQGHARMDALAILRRHWKTIFLATGVIVFTYLPRISYWLSCCEPARPIVVGVLLPIALALFCFLEWRKAFLADKVGTRTKAVLLNRGSEVAIRLWIFLDNSRFIGGDWKVYSTRISILVSPRVMSGARECANFTGLCRRDGTGDWYLDLEFLLNTEEATAIRNATFPWFPRVDLADIVIDASYCRIRGRETGIALED